VQQQTTVQMFVSAGEDRTDEEDQSIKAAVISRRRARGVATSDALMAGSSTPDQTWCMSVQRLARIISARGAENHLKIIVVRVPG
jgi:hypothetical protein